MLPGMLKPIDQYFLQQPEHAKSCLLAMRGILLQYHPHITEAWKYGMPFYCYKSKMFCYLWMHKKYRQPYFGIVEGGRIEHPLLLTEKRARIKILLLDPDKDIPRTTITTILNKALAFYE